MEPKRYQNYIVTWEIVQPCIDMVKNYNMHKLKVEDGNTHIYTYILNRGSNLKWIPLQLTTMMAIVRCFNFGK